MADDEMTYLAIDEADPEFGRIARDAQETLPEFRALLRLPGEANALVAVKARLAAGAAAADAWLMVIQQNRAGFATALIEVPPELAGAEVGDKHQVDAADVLDWMYNMGGILHGGFSLRLQRARLAPDQWPWFDERIGVTQYA